MGTALTVLVYVLIAGYESSLVEQQIKILACQYDCSGQFKFPRTTVITYQGLADQRRQGVSGGTAGITTGR